MKRAVAVLTLLSGAAHAQAPASADWASGSDPAMCELRQAFDGQGGTIEIARTPGNGTTGIVVGGPTPAWAPFHNYSGATVQFQPSGEAVGDLQVSSSHGKLEVVLTTTDPAFMTEFAKASALTISHPKIEPVTVPLRSAGAAAEALRKCEDETMRRWGMDPVAWRALKSSPVPLKPWFDWIPDYPRLALMYGVRGTVVTRLEVTREGTVSDCASINADSPRILTDSICGALKQRARFKPAIGPDGAPTSAPYMLVVKFDIE